MNKIVKTFYVSDSILDQIKSDGMFNTVETLHKRNKITVIVEDKEANSKFSEERLARLSFDEYSGRFRTNEKLTKKKVLMLTAILIMGIVVTIALIPPKKKSDLELSREALESIKEFPINKLLGVGK